jgi:hypothetical protein
LASFTGYWWSWPKHWLGLRTAGVGWPRRPKLGRQWRAEIKLAGAKGSGWPVRVSAGRSEARLGRLYRRGRSRPRAWARGGLDWTPGSARARVGRALACRPGSNTCERAFCPSSGACSRSSEPALALVNAQNLFPSLQATILVWGS